MYMKKIVSLLLTLTMVVTLCLGSGMNAKAAQGGYTQSPSWQLFDTTTIPEGQFADLVGKWLIGTNNYGLAKWYPDRFNNNTDYNKYLTMTGVNEHDIRPLAMEAYGLAISIQTGLYEANYDPAEQDLNKAVVAPATAKAITKQLVKSVAKAHKSNTANGWGGDHWQTSHWAWFAGYAGWLLWDDLEAVDQQYVENMMIYEADNLLSAAIGYRVAPDGTILNQTNSFIEENAWKADCLNLAYAMMPTHPNGNDWMNKAIEFMLAATACPDDIDNEEMYHGKMIKDWINGSNISNEGVVVNHGILHPLYMAINNMHQAQTMFAIGGLPTPRAVKFNINRLYYGLVDHKYNGKYVYVRNSNGEASAQIYLPQGSTWGTEIFDGFSNIDLSAHLFGYDENVTIKGDKWAKVHIEKNLWQQDRHRNTTYYCRTYAGPWEDSYVSREEAVASRAGMSYMSLWLVNQSNSEITYTNDAYGDPTPPQDEVYEDFEGTLVSWQSYIGTPTISTVQSYEGTKSLEIKGKEVLQKNYQGTNSTTVTMRFYDDLAMTDGSIVANLEGNATPYIIGINTWKSPDKYVTRVGGTWYTTTQPRSTGWHEWKWVYNQGSLRMYIDGVQVREVTNPLPIIKIRLGNFWNAPTTAVYFDHIEIE